MNERPPTGYNRLTAAQAQTVDQACDRLEKAWRAGQRPVLETYLMCLNPPLRSCSAS